MRILGTAHIFPTITSNHVDSLIKVVNSVRLGAKMTVKIMTKVDMCWAPGHKIGRTGLGMRRIGSSLAKGFHLSGVGGGEEGPPPHVWQRLPTLHIL